MHNEQISLPESHPEAISEELKDRLQQKAQTEIRRLLDEKVEEYFRTHIKPEDLRAATARVFSWLNKESEQNEEDIDREISNAAHALVEKSSRLS